MSFDDYSKFYKKCGCFADVFQFTSSALSSGNDEFLQRLFERRCPQNETELGLTKVALSKAQNNKFTRELVGVFHQCIGVQEKATSPR